MNRDNHAPSVLGGLLIGAIGGALAVVLFDPKKRQRIIEAVEDLISTSQEKIEDTTNRGRRHLADKLEEVSERLDVDNDDRPRRRNR